MDFNNTNIKPESITGWDEQWDIFSWMEFVTAIPKVLFMITTKKENGKLNLAFHSWTNFTGEGNNFFVLSSGLMKRTHTYKNIIRTREFCINFISSEHFEKAYKSIHEHDYEKDEIISSDFSSEKCKEIDCYALKESFMRLECVLEWEKDLVENSINAFICGKVKHIYLREDFANATIDEKYDTKKYFMFNIHSPKNPFTNKEDGGAIGYIGNLDKRADM